MLLDVEITVLRKLKSFLALLKSVLVNDLGWLQV